ncbi:MAG: hypothetical protein KU37_10145 [Sulfuricurvum sp. PC08-66]|nr:MAG: hypothetical protein KU37_10145 [Sulfuricurvum sp. PC08-66]
MLEAIWVYDWVLLGLIGVSLYVLILNLRTIGALRKEKQENQENQLLLTELLGDLKGYFARIEQRIVGLEEHEQNETHTTDANHDEMLQTLEHMHIALKKQALQLDTLFHNESSISHSQASTLQKFLTQIFEQQKELLLSIKQALYPLPLIQKQTEVAFEHMKEEFSAIFAPLRSASDDAQVLLAKSMRHFDIFFETQIERFGQTANKIETIEEQLKTLSLHVDVVKRNIITTVEQSIDLTPIYKSLHDLIEKSGKVFRDYHTAQSEITQLISALKRHEEQDLKSLRDDVERFLNDLGEELQQSLIQVRQEFNASHRQVSDTVKTLAERTLIKNAYAQSETKLA